MARPVKRTPEKWKNDILNAAQNLFLSKGYENTSVSDIMDMAGGAKGMFYRFFESKEEVIYELANEMFFKNNPFEEIKKRNDLNGLQKIKELLILNQSDEKRNDINMQSVSILKDPHILAKAVEQNRKILTPLWFELLEEAKKDGSIQTEYTKELSELLPLINFWLLPSVYTATEQEIYHKYIFVMEVLCKMGLPILENTDSIKKFISDISNNASNDVSKKEGNKI